MIPWNKCDLDELRRYMTLGPSHEEPWLTKDFSFHIATLKKLGDFSGDPNKIRTIFETYLILGNSEFKSRRSVRRPKGISW